MSVFITKPRIIDPFVVLLVALLVYSIGLFIGAPAPASVEAELPDHWRIVWGVMLMTGTALSLAGIFWPQTYRWALKHALFTERFGLTLVVLACTVYLTCIAAYSGIAGVFASLFVLYVAASVGNRARQIAGVLRRYLRELQR